MNAAQIVKKNRADRKRLRDRVSKRLTAYLAAKDIDMKQLASRLNCSVAQAYRMVSGDRTPEAIMVHRIARLCGVSEESLIDRVAHHAEATQ